MKQRHTLLMRYVLVIISLFFITKTYAQETTTEQLNKRILITNPSPDQLQMIQTAGIDLHCGAKFEGEDLRLDLHYGEVQAIEQLGLSYVVIHDDLSTFYADRAAATREQAEVELRQMKERSLIERAQRASLSTGEASIDSFIQREECQEVDWVSQNFRLGGFLDPSGTPFGGCLTVDEMIIELDRMRTLYPNLISVRQDASPSGQQTHGDVESGDGSMGDPFVYDQFTPQTVYYVRISDNPDVDEPNEPESLITGMTHAREVNSMMNVIYYMWWVLENYELDPAVKNMVDNQEMYFIPIVNPDGVKWNEAITPNGGGLQRKNLRPNVNDNGNINTGNAARGVDLNRNSSYYWGFDNSGSSPTQSFETYRGPSPASEPESQILADFVQSREFKYAINHHSGINSIVTSSYNGDPNAAPSNREDEYQKLMHDVTRFNRYIHGSAPNTLTNANGDTNDYMLGGPDVTYMTVIDDDGDNFGNPGTLQSYTATGSGENIITFSPENGDDFWPPTTDIVLIAQRAVRMNLLTSLYAGKYARLHDFTTTNLTSTTPQLDFQVEYLGQTASDLTLTITPISSNITGVTQAGATTLNGMDILEQRATSATLTLDAGIAVNDPIEYQVTLSNDTYTIYQVNYTKYYNPSVVLNADGFSNWTASGTSNTWAGTTDGYNGSTNAITSTPSPPYGNNVLSFVTIDTPVDLSTANSAVVHFNAKWDIERNFDLAQFEASTDGGSTWIALCGKYTKVPSGEQGNLHLQKNNSDEAHQGNNGTLIYDGDLVVDPNVVNTATANDDVDKWVLEEFLLDAFNNDGITGNNSVLFRFKFDTDSTNRQDGYDTKFEGFTFDNFQVSTIDLATTTCTGELVDAFPDTENFEGGLGYFIQSNADDGDWLLDTGGTPTGGTGPTSGTNGATYLYVEASSPGTTTGGINQGNTAILNSSCIDLSSSSSASLDFDYHMQTSGTFSTVPTLNVQVSQDNGVTWINATAEIPGTASSDWISRSIDLDTYTGGIIRIRFVGMTGVGSFQGDIAIDNVVLTASPAGICLAETTYTTASGWDNDVPDENTSAIINGDYDTASLGNITACELTINSGVTLTVSDATFISVYNDITVDGILDVSNAGSVVQVAQDATTINNGTIEVSKTTPLLGDRDFIILSSPMTAETTEGVYTAADRVFEIISANFVPNTDPLLNGVVANFIDDNGDYLNNVTASSGDDMPTTLNPTEGYLIFPLAVGAAGDVVFDHSYTLGTLNTGTIMAPITYNGPNTANNFNLLGNPYASAIDTDAFITSNIAVNQVYFWDHITAPSADLPGFNNVNHDMDDVSVRNMTMGVASQNDVGMTNIPGQYMASGQGFAILADQTAMGTDVTFTNAMRETGHNGTPRAPQQENRLWLSLGSDQYTIESHTGIGFTDLATAGFDRGYDSNRLATTISLFSTLENGEQLIINGREAFDTSMEINLGFSTLIPERGNYTVSIGKLEGEDLEQADIFLIDNLLNTITNLKEVPYTFQSNETIQENRFTLVFEDKVLSIDNQDALAQNELRLYPNPTKNLITLQDNGGLNLKKLVVRDMLGKTVMNIDLSSFNQEQTFNINHLNAGVYFFQITTASSSESIRVIKY